MCRPTVMFSSCAATAAARRADSPARCRWQRERRPLVPTGYSSGGAVRHTSQAYGQRGSKRQAGGRLNGDGTTPLIAERRPPRFSTRRDRLDQAHRVGRCAARASTSSTVPCSTIWPAYITITLSTISATTPRSWVISSSADAGPLLDRLEQLEDLGLDRDVERGRRLVGDQQLRLARERHRDHHALAHAARQLVRVLLGAPLRASGSRPAAASRSPGPRTRVLADLLVELRPARRSGRRP